MTEHRIDDGLLPQIPDFDIVVDPARVDLVAGLGNGDGGDGELGLDVVDGILRPRVPYAYRAVVAPADQQLLASLRRVYCVDDLLVPDVPPYPRARRQVPAGEVHVCRGRI